MFPLGLLTVGEIAEIVSIRETAVPDAKKECRLEDMGLRTGKWVEMLSNSGGGALLLKVDESRIAMARTMAMKILVRRKG